MKTISARLANERIFRYRGTMGLEIDEVIVGDPSANSWRDREVVVPCGFTGSLKLTVRDTNISLGGERNFREGHKKGADKKPILDLLKLTAVVERGMVYGDRVEESFFDLNVFGNESIKTGAMLERCRKVVVSGVISDIGVQDRNLTGQGYCLIVKESEESIIHDLVVSGARYGVSFTGYGRKNKAINIVGDVSVALVDFHSGMHHWPYIAGVDSVKDGNEKFGGGSVQGTFIGVKNYQLVKQVIQSQ